MTLNDEISSFVSRLVSEYLGDTHEIELLLEQLVRIEQETGSFDAALGPLAYGAFTQIDHWFAQVRGTVLGALPFETRSYLHNLPASELRAWSDEWARGMGLGQTERIPTLIRFMAWLCSRHVDLLLSPLEKEYIELKARHAPSEEQPNYAEAIQRTKTAQEIRLAVEQCRAGGGKSGTGFERASVGKIAGRLLREAGCFSHGRVQRLIEHQTHTIVRACKKQGISGREIAKRSGLDLQTVQSALARPRCAIRMSTYVRLSAAFEVPCLGVILSRSCPVGTLVH